jgi:hypothetical protein
VKRSAGVAHYYFEKDNHWVQEHRSDASRKSGDGPREGKAPRIDAPNLFHSHSKESAMITLVGNILTYNGKNFLTAVNGGGLGRITVSH